MSVLIDSTIWSLAFRRKTASAPQVAVWEKLIRQGQVLIIGAVRQEVLSGIRERAHFEKLREQLRAFTDVALFSSHYERAAEMSNICRSRGIQGSATDFLLCATADLNGFSVFTTDHDFLHIARHFSIRLHR